MIDTYSIALRTLVEKLNLTIAFQSTDYNSVRLTVEDVARPGLQLAGYFDHFEPMRLQIMGNVDELLKQTVSPGPCGDLRPAVLLQISRPSDLPRS